jgi:type IV secretion system protein VirB5
MLFGKSKKTAVAEEVPNSADAPWILAARRHEDTFLRLNAQVANWRLFAFFAMGVSTLAVAGLVYIGQQSKFVPMIVEVDKLGRTLAVRALTGEAAISDPSRYAYRELFDLVENLRSVTTDRTANNDRLEKGFTRLSGAARNYVRTELKKAPANDVGATKTVQVQVKTALSLADKVSGKTWQVEWEEHSFSLNGEEIGVEKWKATVQYELIPSGDAEMIRKNPVGFTVTEINWMKVI